MKNIKSTTLLAFIFFAIFSAHSQSILNHPQIKYTTVTTEVSSLPSNYQTVVNNLDESYKMSIPDYKELLELFDEKEYTPETWKAGIREIPRLYVTDFGKWRTKGSKEVSVLYKKRIFFRSLAPMILHANEMIMEDRARLEKNITAFKLNNAVNENEEVWIRNLAGLYKTDLNEGGLTLDNLNELHKKVDIIPASLALAQAAAESGWGTSRFADLGNAVFGQWAWGDDAMVPKEKREHLGNYGVAAFGTIQESVSSYMLNLNRHYAYSDLREIRAQMRADGKEVSGYELAEGLLRYSEKGESYVKTLRSIMDYNQLRVVDDAYLKNEKPLFLFPEED